MNEDIVIDLNPFNPEQQETLAQLFNVVSQLIELSRDQGARLKAAEFEILTGKKRLLMHDVELAGMQSGRPERIIN